MGLTQNKALLNKDVLGIVKLVFFGKTECKTYIKPYSEDLLKWLM